VSDDQVKKAIEPSMAQTTSLGANDMTANEFSISHTDTLTPIPTSAIPTFDTV
jgi:hypothetical protein